MHLAAWNTACAQIQGFVASAKTTLAVSSASSNVALPATGSTLNVLIQNTGSTDADLVLGLTNGTVATTSNQVLSAGQWMWFPQGPTPTSPRSPLRARPT